MAAKKEDPRVDDMLKQAETAAPEKPSKKTKSPVLYRSRYKSHGIKTKSGTFVTKSNGDKVQTKREQIKFQNFFYQTSNPEEIEYLDNMIANGNLDIFKEPTTEEKIKAQREEYNNKLAALDAIEAGLKSGELKDPGVQ